MWKYAAVFMKMMYKYNDVKIKKIKIIQIEDVTVNF